MNCGVIPHNFTLHASANINCCIYLFICFSRIIDRLKKIMQQKNNTINAEEQPKETARERAVSYNTRAHSCLPLHCIELHGCTALCAVLGCMCMPCKDK